MKCNKVDIFSMKIDYAASMHEYQRWASRLYSSFSPGVETSGWRYTNRESVDAALRLPHCCVLLYFPRTFFISSFSRDSSQYHDSKIIILY